MRHIVSTGAIALATLLGSQAHAQEALVGVCSGVSLPRSVVTDITGNVLAPVIAPIEGILGTLTLGTVNLNLSGALTNAAAGAPISLGVLDVNGNAVNLATTPRCVSQADGYTLRTPAGLAFGGNRITGLGTAGRFASAAESNAIALGDDSVTGAGAVGAVAIGSAARVTATGALGSVALGQNSLATGATLGTAAYLTGGTAAAEVNIGDRRLTGLAAGATDTDAVNVAQLKAATLGLGPVDAITFDAGLGVYNAARGGVPTAITNVAPAALTATSTDAVNGSQLFATNGAVAGLQANALLYDPALTAFTAARGGAPSTITNVAPAALTATSTDAVNGSQLFATNQQVTGNTTAISNLTTNIANGTADPLAVRYADATKGTLTLGGAGGTLVSNVTAGALSATSSDAVNGSQLFATNAAVTTNAGNISTLTTNVNGLQGNALLFDATLNAYNAGRGGVPTVITNVAPAALTATSSDAVNGAQLFGTNQLVAGNTTAITNLSATIANGTADPLAVRYADATKGTLTLGGVNGTVVGNVTAGALTATSRDAVNGSQLFATNAAVTSNTTAIGSLTTNVSSLQGNALLFDAALNAYNAGRGGAPTVITNVAPAALTATSTDAVNGSQLFATNQQVATLTASVANGTADPLAVRYADATKGTLALGGANGTVVTNVAAGAVTTTSTDAVNGAQLNATNQAVAAVDTRVTNLGTSVASSLGGGSVVNADGSVTAPTYQVATVGAGGTTTTSTYTDVGSAITGLGSSISNVNTRIAAATDRAVTYDGAVGSARDTLTLAGAGGTRIANLSAGAVNATSTDAVNGAQLNAVGQQVAANTSNITTLNTNVTNLQNGTAGFFRVNNTANNPAPVATGANAIAAGGGTVSSGANAVALGTAASATGANSVALGSGSLADRDNSVSVGSATATRQLTNVAAGTMATDAVNLGQLTSGLNQTLASANAYTDGRLAQVGFDLQNVRRDANGGTAAAMALATIPQAYGPGMGMVGGGVSTWGGEQAFAIGVSKATTDGGIVVKAGATINTRGKGGGAAGVGFAF
ncbi:YadA-like family protein [Sphingomonas sp. RB3P16]|uniref:YadA-like family protein n=1 Tax=Parasphingomonas frigoris TaxID=3096163 RepID=UPI002FCB101A